MLMDNIILYLLTIIQEQYNTICWLILFICRYIPLKQWAHDEIHSPKYQKFLTDKLPVIKPFIKQDWLLVMSITGFATAKQLNLSKLKMARPALSLKIPYVPSAVLRMSTSMITPVVAVNSNARSAVKPLSTVRK